MSFLYHNDRFLCQQDRFTWSNSYRKNFMLELLNAEHYFLLNIRFLKINSALSKIALNHITIQIPVNSNSICKATLLLL